MTRVYGALQTVLVTSRAEISVFGKKKTIDNIITLDWHMPCSFEPFLYAISIGKTRTSCQLIHNSKCFVVNFVPYTLKKQALFCGRHSGLHIDKFKETGLTKIEAKHLDCPAIEEACGYLECNVINEIDVGDHVIFLARVTYQEIKSKVPGLYHEEGDEFKTIA